MFTLGYDFRPWADGKAIADGPSIRRYVRDTARDHGVEDNIRFHHRVVRAEWSSEEARWTVTAERTDTGETVELTCAFLFGAPATTATTRATSRISRASSASAARSSIRSTGRRTSTTPASASS